MSSRDWRNRVRDILDAISEIQKFTRGMDYETFKEDAKSVRAVEMNFIIIGEAESHRTCLFHVDEKLMWDTVQNDLPPLIPELKKLL